MRILSAKIGIIYVLESKETTYVSDLVVYLHKQNEDDKLRLKTKKDGDMNSSIL